MESMMERKFSSFSISLTELKKNPTRVKRDAGLQPIAVLNHHKPAFYLLDPDVYETMPDKLEDISVSGLVNERLAMKPQAVEVDSNTV